MRTPLRSTPAVVSLFGLASLVVACSSGAHDATTDSASASSSGTSATTTSSTSTTSTSAAPDSSGRPGDLRITTPDNAVVLALAGDSVWMGLSDSVLTKARLATDSARTKAAASKSDGIGGQFGAMIADKVTAAVDAGLRTRVAYALSELRSVSYDAGTIHFEYQPGVKHMLSFEDVKTGDNNESRPVLSQFAPADAQRFVAAVRARSGGRMTFPPKPASP